MTSYLFATGFGLFLVVMAVLTAWRPRSLDSLDEKQLRAYRGVLEGRGPWAMADAGVLGFGCLWLFSGVIAIARSMPDAYLYFVPALLFLLAFFVRMRDRPHQFARLGDRGQIERTRAEQRAVKWYRRWIGIGTAAIVGVATIEFADPSPRGGAMNSIYIILSVAIVVAPIAVLVTFLNARENAKQERLQ